MRRSAMRSAATDGGTPSSAATRSTWRVVSKIFSARARARAEKIFDTTRHVLRAAADEGVPPSVAADRIAERRMAEVGRLRTIYL